MARRYGRSPRGRRLDGPIPHGHWKATTFVGGLTARGFVAPYVLDGPMNGAVFRAWVEQMLAPELRPGDIVVMDNLAAHKVDGIAQAITDQGAELRYLPPYSPDLNPIEQAFAKLKALLRKAAERTVDGLWTAIGQLLELFPPAECANYLSNSGYPRAGDDVASRLSDHLHQDRRLSAGSPTINRRRVAIALLPRYIRPALA